MRFGFLISLLIHSSVVLIGFLSLPSNWRPDVQTEPVIPISLIAEAELDLTTSVPAAAPEPVEEAEPEPEPVEPEPEPEPEPPAPAEETEPEPAPEPEPEPEPAPVEEEPEPEPEPVKPEPKPEPKEEELDLAALSQLINKEREKETSQSDAPAETSIEADQARAAIGPGDRLTASDQAKMRAAVEQCWNTGAVIGAPEPEKLIVILEIDLNRDGSLRSAPRVANALQINLSGNRFWKVAEQSAVRAVVSCAPYNFLPQDRYDTWKEFRLNFDPSQMVGR